MKFLKQLMGSAVVLTALVLSGCAQKVAAKPKIGFLVKQAEEPWFQVEWAFADKAGAELGFDVVKIAVPDAEKTLAAIDTLASQGVKAFVICTPDTRLGPAIMAKANAAKMKVITVDDRFLDAKDKDMEEVVFLGMDAYAMGEQQGTALIEESKKRGWILGDVTVLLVSFDELDTSVQRNKGALKSLKDGGIKDTQIVKVAEKWPDIPSAMEASMPGIASVPKAKRFFIVGFNDNSVLGGVRATENYNIPAANVIGVGINGTDIVDEFKKDKPSGMYASLLLAPDLHGYQTAKMAYEWVKDNKQPPLHTPVRQATLVTRENFKAELQKKGLWKD